MSSVEGGFGVDKCALELVGVPPYFDIISCNLPCCPLVSSSNEAYEFLREGQQK
jgi:hypothetical protein